MLYVPTVLPPPPRYPNGNLYTGAPGGGLLETNNILTTPSGPEYQLVVGEGTYVLKDDLHLATPPPHPSDVPQPNNNPLATFIGPPTAGVKLSIAVLAPRRPTSHHLFRSSTSHSARTAIPPSIQEETQSPKSDAGSITNGFGSTSYYDHVSAFGDNNPALQAIAPIKKGKDLKSKPKNNIIKSNSSYVSRVIPHEAMPKRLADHPPDGIYAFANVNRAFMWLDLSSDIKTENMTKVLFTKAHPLCHDINPITLSGSHVDVILGFNTSDIIWYEPMSQKYARLNKNGQINPSPVLSILWAPNKENIFFAAHMDGTIVAYDKEKEDAAFVPEEHQPMENGHAEKASAQFGFKILKSVLSKEQKTNPIAVWKMSNMKINSMAFSPDGQLLAVVCEDGTLRIIDYINEKVKDVYRSFFGAMMCVTWSPDGRYVLAGGQDDLVSIWSVADQAIVARCIGHHAWVTDVKFDPWRCDDRNYRFGSVGEDCRLLLWDFSVGMLGRSKALSVRNRNSISSHMNANRKESYSTVNRIRSNSTKTSQPDVSSSGEAENGEEVEVVHPVDSKASTATLPPVMSKQVDEHPLTSLQFEEHCILVSSKEGTIREWSRPADESAAGSGRLAPPSASTAKSP